MTISAASHCALRLSLADLSAWRDHQLTSAMAARLDAHIPHCGACQERLNDLSAVAQAVRRHQPPTLLQPAMQAQLWRSIARAHALSSSRTKEQIPMSRFTPRRAGAAAVTVALVIALAVTISRFAAQRHAGTQPPPLPTSQKIVSPEQAWGAHAVKSFPIAHFGYAQFEPTAISPDGRYVVGNASSDGQNVIPVLIDLTLQSARQLDPNAPVSDTLGNITNPLVDSRYVAYDHEESPLPALKSSLAIFDTQSQQTRYIPLSKNYSAATLGMHEGQIVWQQVYEGDTPSTIQQTPLFLTDAASGKTSTIVYTSFDPVTVSWPYVVYTAYNSQSQTTTQHAYNIDTHHDVVLPRLTGSSFAFATNGGVFSAISGIDHGYSNTTYYQLDLSGNHVGSWHAIATVFGYDSELSFTATDRLIALQDTLFDGDSAQHDVAWDRVLQKRVDLGHTGLHVTLKYGDITDDGPVMGALRPQTNGNWITYVTVDNQAFTLHVIDSSQLPTR